MPLNQINWAAIQPQKPDYSGLENFLPNFLEAREAPGKMANEREMMKQALMQAQLGNQIKGVQAKYAEPEAKNKMAINEEILKSKNFKNMMDRAFGKKQAEAKLKLLEAQTAHQNRLSQEGGGSSGALSTFGKLMRERDDAIQKHGENSKQVKMLDDYMTKLSGGGFGAVTSPVRTKYLQAQMGGKARQWMDQNVKMPYYGPTASNDMKNDVLKYNKLSESPEKEELKRKLAIAIVSEKLLPDYSMYQLQDLGQNVTVHALKAQEKANRQNWPVIGHALLNNMPRDIQELANEMHSNAITSLSDVRNQAYEGALQGGQGSKAFEGLSTEEQSNEMPDEFGYTRQDYEDTAAKYNTSVEQVMRRVREGG